MDEKTTRLNAPGREISDVNDIGYGPVLSLSTYSQYSQRERKKGAKKERERTAAILFKKEK